MEASIPSIVSQANFLGQRGIRLVVRSLVGDLSHDLKEEIYLQLQSSVDHPDLESALPHTTSRERPKSVCRAILCF